MRETERQRDREKESQRFFKLVHSFCTSTLLKTYELLSLPFISLILIKIISVSINSFGRLIIATPPIFVAIDQVSKILVVSTSPLATPHVVKSWDSFPLEEVVVDTKQSNNTSMQNNTTFSMNTTTSTNNTTMNNMNMSNNLLVGTTTNNGEVMKRSSENLAPNVFFVPYKRGPVVPLRKVKQVTIVIIVTIVTKVMS